MVKQSLPEQVAFQDHSRHT